MFSGATEESSETHSDGARTPWVVLVFGLTFPTFVTWLYFVALADSPSTLQQSAYLGGKIVQFVFPIAWVFGIEKTRLRFNTSRAGIGIGIASGLAIVMAMLGLYLLVLRPNDFFAQARPSILAKVQGMGIASPLAFAATGMFYSLFHSGLEEYYWRWFVFKRLRTVTSLGVAVTASSLGFMAHHVLVLATFFGASSYATYLFSLGVAVGGILWSLLYERSRSLIGPWVSHALVDAGIFLVGYDLVSSLFHQ